MKAISRLKIGLIILAVSLLLFLLAFFYYKSESGQIIKEKHEFLKAVTNIKLEQIVRWRAERIDEAEFFPTIGKIVKSVSELKTNKNNKDAKQYFSSTLKRFKDNGYFENVFITDINGPILFSLDSSFITMDQVRIEEIKAAVEKDSAIIGDFYFSETHKTIHFNVVSIIKDNSGIPIGVYVQIVDPYKSLYPIIQSWPVSSKTAETLLFKKENDHVVYLNDLRHKKNSALSLKIPTTESEIIAVKAVLGARGIIEGKDYRGKDVLADVKTVPGTDWFMVSKVDREELYSELFYRAGVISLIALISILLISFSAFYIYKFQQSNTYKNLFLKQKELAETQEEYKTTLYSIGDAVITTDMSGKIKQMNSVAETLTGWKEIEVKGKSLNDVFKVINEETNLPVEGPVNRVLREGVVVGLANHTMLISKKGNKIPIADSGSPIKNSDGKITGVVLVFRDQTEERVKEQELAQSEEKFRKAFTTSPDSININRISDGMYITINDGFTKMTGYTVDEVIGKSSLDINIWADIEDRKKLVERLKEKGIVENLEARFRLKNGELKNGLMSASILELNGEKHILSITRDISERKKAEEIIKSSEANLNSLINNRNESIWSIDKNYNYIVFNNFFAEAYFAVYNQKLVKGINALNILTPELKAFWRPKYDAALSGERKEFEFSVELNNGIKFFQVLLNPIVSDGTVTGVTALSVDITEKKLSEKALKENELRLQTIVSNAPVVLFGIDKYGIFTFSEGKGLKALGLKPGEVVGLSAFELYKDFPLVVEVIKQALKGETNSAIHTMGKLVFDVNYAPVKNEVGEILGIIGVANDITTRWKAERESSRLLNIIDKSFNEIYLFDAETLKFEYINEGAKKNLGYSEEQIKSFTPIDIKPDFTVESFKALIDPLLKKEKDKLIIETRHKRSDGSTYLAEIYLQLVEQADKPQFLAIINDISERKKAEEALCKSEDRYRILSQNTSDFTFACSKTDKGYKLDWMAGATLKLTGYSIEDILEKGCWRFIVHPEDDELFKKNVIEIPAGKNSECELRIIAKEGASKWIRVNTTCLNTLEKNTEGVYGSCSDITSQKIAEESLRANEQKYRLLFETNPHPMWVYDLETFGFLAVNDSAIAKYGYTKDEFMNMTIKQIRPEEDIDKLIENVEHVTEGLDDAGVWRHKKKDGSIIQVEIVSHTLNFEGRRAEMILAHDVTEKILAERELKESQQRLSLALSSTKQGIYDLNVQTGVAIVTPEYATMLGYDPVSFKETNENWIGRLHPDDREITTKAYLDYIEGITLEYRVEFRQKTQDNKWKWILSLGKTVEYDSNGKPLRMLGTHTDITEQKSIEENVKRLSRAVEQSPVIIMITDTDGEIDYVNPKFTEVTGYTFDEVINKNPRFLKSGHNTAEEYRYLWETITKHKEWRGEFLNRKKNGELYWESAFISPLINEQGKVTNYIAVKEDITDRKKMIADLVEAKAKADEMNRVKAYFFANMSHELRTPFVGIMGFSEMLTESLNNPAEKEMAEQILKSSKRLTETLNKILNVTRLEFDKVDVKISDVDVVGLIKQLTTLFSMSGTIKNTVVGSTFSPDIIRVRTDRKLLEEILTNLLNNAIKYTQNGAIEIIARNKRDEKGDRLIIKVADTGIGIPKDKQEIIWQEFRQVSEGMNRSFEGTGLGLTIIKKYIDTLGGQISLESEPHKGSTFTVELPVENLEDREIIAPQLEASIEPIGRDEDKSRKPKILYVEDDVIALSYIDKILRAQYEIDTAFNAAIALDLANRNKYEIALLDINLGRGIDGVELMQMIRKIKGFAKIPMVAVTAYAAHSDKTEFLAKGFTHYISKPFTKNQILNLLKEVLSS